MLPYDLIQENPERKWHRQLLDRLVTPGVGEDELDDIAVTLEILDDYRVVRPLLDILTDRAYSPAIRENAGYVLIHMSTTLPVETLETWWQTGDPALQKTVLLMSGPAQADIVLSVVQDSGHPLYIDGIRALEVGFERAEFQGYKIDALQNPDPKIRDVAATCLLWNEPIAAEEALLAATYDPAEAVVEAACDTLQYYPTQRVFRRVSAMEGYSTKYIRDDLIIDLHDPGRQAHLRKWLDPIWDMLQLTEEELNPPPQGEPGFLSPRSKPSRHMSVSQINDFLENTDGTAESAQDVIRETDWLAISEPDRGAVARRLIAHPDHIIREMAPLVFETWQYLDGLVALFHDSSFPVRKSATYHLGLLITPSRDVAAMLWSHLGEPDAWGTHSYETLDAYVTHADPTEAVQKLIDMAENRAQTETLRYHAVANLQRLNAVEAIQHLLPLVQEPPSVTWGLHVILLDAAYRLNLKPPPLTQYLAIDHAHIQTAIAPFVD